jgi:hypothetical protein
MGFMLRRQSQIPQVKILWEQMVESSDSEEKGSKYGIVCKEGKTLVRILSRWRFCLELKVQTWCIINNGTRGGEFEAQQGSRACCKCLGCL